MGSDNESNSVIPSEGTCSLLSRQPCCCLALLHGSTGKRKRGRGGEMR